MVPKHVTEEIEKAGIRCHHWHETKPGSTIWECDAHSLPTSDRTLNFNVFVRACEVRPGEWSVQLYNEVKSLLITSLS